jgi:hypothetical protein
LLCGVVLGLGLVRVRPEVELIRGIRVETGERVGVQVVAGGGVGVRVGVGYDLLAGPARGGSLRVGPTGVAGATCEALVGWGFHMRWLSSRLAYDSPRGRRVRVGGGSKLEVGLLKLWTYLIAEIILMDIFDC